MHALFKYHRKRQDQAFATNTEEPKIFELDLDDRTKTANVNMTLEGAPYPCAR